jgi:hypothetical protein
MGLDPLMLRHERATDLLTNRGDKLLNPSPKNDPLHRIYSRKSLGKDVIRGIDVRSLKGFKLAYIRVGCSNDSTSRNTRYGLR